MAVAKFTIRSRSTRSGFTLIELLVVIAIIGMLMALMSMAIWGAFERAKEAAIVTEVTQLVTAVQAYKEKAGDYPTAMAITSSDGRKTRFLQHLRTAFPSSAYGQSVTSFDNLNTYVSTNYVVLAGGGPGTVALNLNRLDQAEALVFWLGGFPTPSPGGVPIAPSRLFGFNKDTDSPMKRSPAVQEGQLPLNTRTDSFYEFKQNRLVDNDNDGWWEYLPTDTSTGGVVAPFVYFDAESYGSTGSTGSVVGYPRNGDASANELANVWGLAVPMAAYFDPKGASPTRWQSPDSFQIISGGLDGKYSASTTASAMRIEIFPKGFTYTSPNYNDNPPKNFAEESLDNITSLAPRTLEDAKKDAP